MKDHREIGKEMQLFAFDEEVGPGLPLWLPNGTVLIEELEKLAKDYEFLFAYQRVKTPHIAKQELYEKSGHLKLYRQNMFPPMAVPGSDDDGSGDATISTDAYYLKAMNCPHHHKIFSAVPRSYRDLPLRLAEYGTCYRYESAGSLMGLMRVRSMQMNDAHIYCTEEQFGQEFFNVHKLMLCYFDIFGIKDYKMRFSTHDPAKLGEKYVDSPHLWKETEEWVRSILQRLRVDQEIEEVPGEAAFYGPKIDILIKSNMGREFTLATYQVDFDIPKKFGLEYRDADNKLKTPICIHRAPLGTHERFIAFLIEHYQGNFPLWLRPVQARVLTIRGDSHEQNSYAMIVVALLRQEGIRAEVDTSFEPIKAKIQRAEQDKVHSIMVVGDREVNLKTINLRRNNVGMGAYLLQQIGDDMRELIRNRINQ